VLRTRLQHGHQVFVAGDLLLVDEDVRVFQLALHLLRVGDEVRRQVSPRVELHALDELVGRLEGLAFLDGDGRRPLPTLSMASAMMRADLAVVCWRPRWATDSMSFLDLTSFFISLSLAVISSTARSMPRFHEHRIDAGDDGPRSPSLKMALGEDGGGGGTVAGHITGLAWPPSRHHAGAHVLVLVLQFDLPWRR